MKKFIIGSDPEIFVFDKTRSIIGSVIGQLGGTKEKPISIGNNCFVQEDNILSEFNIPPVDNKEDFINNINFCKDYISTKMMINNKNLHFSSSEIVSDEILTEDKAKVFGCEPSMNIITESMSDLDMNLVPEEFKNLRTSGFHIHFGYDNPNFEDNCRIVLCFELAVSIPLYFDDNDKFNRRLFYGKFGDCREKDYGVECRSLGGYFLKDDETLSLVWDKIEECIELFNSEIPTSKIKDMVEFCIGDNNTVIKESVQEIKNELNKYNLIQK